MTKEQLFQAAKTYFMEIEQDRKALLKLYPQLEKKHFRMSAKGRKNISKGIKEYWKNKKEMEKKENGKKSQPKS